MLYASKSKSTIVNENLLFWFVFSGRYLVTIHRELELYKLKKKRIWGRYYHCSQNCSLSFYEGIVEKNLNITRKVSVRSLLSFNKLCLMDLLSNQVMIIWKRHLSLFMQGVPEWLPLYFLCFMVVIRFTTRSVINHIW